MRVNLNLSTTPLANNRRFVTAAGLIGLAGVVALVFFSVKDYATWRADRNVRADIGRLEDEIRRSEDRQRQLGQYFDTAEAKQVLDRSAFLNSLIEERTFPWPKIFEDLEQTLPSGVRIVSISPRLEGGRALVKLTFAATDSEGTVKFLRALEASKQFSEIHVQDEKYAEPGQGQGVAQDPITVTLDAWYSTT